MNHDHPNFSGYRGVNEESMMAGLDPGPASIKKTGHFVDKKKWTFEEKRKRLSEFLQEKQWEHGGFCKEYFKDSWNGLKEFWAGTSYESSDPSEGDHGYGEIEKLQRIADEVPVEFLQWGQDGIHSEFI